MLPTILPLVVLLPMFSPSPPPVHLQAHLRWGVITRAAPTEPRSTGVAIGGHLHLDSPRLIGLRAEATLFAVQDLGLVDPAHLHPDFFDARGKGYVLLGEAFLDGQWGKAHLRLGRQRVETPHADSDDLRMMPNLFMAYAADLSHVGNFSFHTLYFTHMAGWENGVDCASFVPLRAIPALAPTTDGAFAVAAVYQAWEKLEFQLWGYRFDDFADVAYAQLSYGEHRRGGLSWSTTLQLDIATGNGMESKGKPSSRTWGVGVELRGSQGYRFHAAFNRDDGAAGAFPSLGAGPFLTSMEVLTLDALGRGGQAHVLGAQYRLTELGLPKVSVGAAWGRFHTSVTPVHDSDELDLNLDWQLTAHVSMLAAWATIRDRHADAAHSSDLDHFRILAHMTF